MARPPKAWYAHDAWYTDFGKRNRLLLRGPKNADTRLLAEKELIRLREEAKFLKSDRSPETPFAVVVEEFLEQYVGRPAYADFSNQLHYFMGGSTAKSCDGTNSVAVGKRVRPSGGRFGIACKSWPIRRINADVVEKYLRRKKAAGQTGYHSFVALRTLMNWARKKGFITHHDLDGVDVSLRRKGRRRFMPSDEDVVQIFNAADEKFKEVLLAYTLTGIRPSELRSVTIDEFDRAKRQWVLWRHKVSERTGMPKVVPLPTDELVEVCVNNAGDRPGTETIFLNRVKRPWTYNALRIRWFKLRTKLGLNRQFTLYCLRHWYLTMAIESGEDSAIVSELAGHADRASLDYYKKIRNQRLHQASHRVAQTIARVGILGLKPMNSDDKTGDQNAA